VESIERGVPVHYMREEDGVIVGYADEGATWLCYHVFHECGRELLEVTEWPWGLCVFGEPAPPKKDRLTLAMEALGQACDMAQTPAVGDYYCGYEAWRQLAESLRVLEGEDPVELAGPLHANAWGYECLVRFHRSARAYLTELAGEHEEAAAALLKAAEIYRRLADQVLTYGGCTFFNIAPYAWSFGDGAPWTQETRLTEDERLEAGLPLEREASGYIAEALTTLRAKPESAVQRATRRPVYP
jgi:hypothetical protein